MNATKRLLTGAAIAAGALGIGAGAFFACRQELSPGAQSEATIERKAGDAKFTDGDYRFYFKNGKSISGDCDGYNVNTGADGKTTIYEWFQTDINDWVKRLKNAGITYEVFRSGFGYCWVRFDTNQLKAIGLTYYGRCVSLIIKDGKKVNLPSAWLIVESGNKFNIRIRGTSTVFSSSPMPEALKLLETIGIKPLETYENEAPSSHVGVIIDGTGVFIAQNNDPWLL